MIGMSRKPVASQQATTGLATCNDDGGADAAATARSLPLRLVMERDRVLVLLLQTRPQSRYVRALPILKQVQEKTRLRLVPLQPNQLRFQSTTSSSSSAALSTAAAAVAGFPALDRNTLLLGASSSSSSFLWSTSQPSYANYYAPPSQSSGHSRFNLLLGGGAQREESMRDPFVGGSSTQTSGDGGGGGGDDDVGLSMDHNVLPGVLGASAPSLFAFVENQKVFLTILQNGTVCAYDSES